MKSKFYLLLINLILLAAVGNAQNACLGEAIKWQETFGTGTSSAALPNGRTNYAYKVNGSLNDGDYRLSTTTQCKPEWISAPDHTGDLNGRMMVTNASFTAGEFYRDTVFGLTPNAFYSVSLYIMNVNTLGTCGATAILPKLQFVVEVYNSGNGTFNQLVSFTSDLIPQKAAATWVKAGGAFTLPQNATAVRYRIINNSVGGCGNDLAIDDITFSQCSMVSSLPVNDLKVSAVQQSGGVDINWSTANEINTSRFEVEKSFDGSNWETIQSVAAAVNSNRLQKYSIADKGRFTATSYYRLRLVDADGKFAYSSVVVVKPSAAAMKAASWPNPFSSNLTIALSSDKSETVTVRLIDQSGRVVKMINRDVKKGMNTTNIDNLGTLAPGMYFLDVRNAQGEMLYNNKILK